MASRILGAERDRLRVPLLKLLSVLLSCALYRILTIGKHVGHVAKTNVSILIFRMKYLWSTHCPNALPGPKVKYVLGVFANRRSEKWIRSIRFQNKSYQVAAKVRIAWASVNSTTLTLLRMSRTFDHPMGRCHRVSDVNDCLRISN